jgi:hypothetical protein
MHTLQFCSDNVRTILMKTEIDHQQYVDTRFRNDVPSCSPNIKNILGEHACSLPIVLQSTIFEVTLRVLFD